MDEVKFEDESNKILFYGLLQVKTSDYIGNLVNNLHQILYSQKCLSAAVHSRLSLFKLSRNEKLYSNTLHNNER